MNIIKLMVCLMVFVSSVARSQLNFDWSKGKAEVTETISKKGSSMTFRYMIEVVERDEGWVLEQNFVDLISVNNQKVTDRRMSRALSQVAKFPRLIIDSKGNAVDVKNEESFFKAYARSIPDPKLAEMLENPAYREIVLMQYIQKWCHWVCLWNIDGLSESSDVETTEDIEFMGQLLPQKSTTVHHGQLVDSDGLVKLTFKSKTESNQVNKLIEQVTDEFGFKTKPEPTEDEPDLLSKTMDVEALIDPDTLKPQKVTVEINLSAQSQKKNQSQTEKYSYKFVWK